MSTWNIPWRIVEKRTWTILCENYCVYSCVKLLYNIPRARKLLIWQNHWSKTDSENIQIQKLSRSEPAWSNTKSTKTMAKVHYSKSNWAWKISLKQVLYQWQYNIKRTKHRRMDWRDKGSRKKLPTCTMNTRVKQ